MTMNRPATGTADDAGLPPAGNTSLFNAVLQTSLAPLPLRTKLRQTLQHVLSPAPLRLLGPGAIFLLDRENASLNLAAQHGFNAETLKPCRRVPLGTCFCGQAALTGKPVYGPHANGDYRAGVHPSGQGGHYCLPILSGDRLLGVIAFHPPNDHRYQEEEGAILGTVSSIVAGMIAQDMAAENQQALVREKDETIIRLEKEKTYTASIIQSLNSGLMVVDGRGEILTCNTRGEEILGRFTELSGKRQLADVMGVEEAAGILSPPAGPEDTSASRRIEVDLIAINGEQRTLGLKITPHEKGPASPGGLILSFVDITDLKQARQEMEKMNRLSTVAEIAAAVAHEIRNPLAGIKTMSQAIEENMTAADSNREYITRIIRQVDRLNQLLNEFFTYARPAKPKKHRISLSTIISETRALISSRLKKFRIGLKENYQKSLPDIWADPNQLQQVFLNLFLNSIEALNGPGRIEITARRMDPVLQTKYQNHLPFRQNTARTLVVTFTDSGPGMEAGVADKAFEPFFSTKRHGSGLGLAIVHRILEENNAAVHIDRTAARGVTFIIFFEVSS